MQEIYLGGLGLFKINCQNFKTTIDQEIDFKIPLVFNVQFIKRTSKNLKKISVFVVLQYNY